MKKSILKILTCPVCLPKETVLTFDISEEREEDILEGSLTCPRCEQKYPIKDGIAFLDPNGTDENQVSTSKYEAAPVISSYLWSHYGDLLNDDHASSAYLDWTDLMQPKKGMALDAGCAVGRFTFEMARKSDFAIGIDNSHAFIRTARELMLKKEKDVHLMQEGRISQETKLSLPPSWQNGNVEFLVADAQALPFKSGVFTSLASLNLVDKLPLPLKHLKEINRLALPAGAQFLFSDPFSWSEEAADPENWLGGTDQGPYAGNGVDNVMGLLNGRPDGLRPHWHIEKNGEIWWKIRTHQNHFELIRSCFVKANR